MSKKPITIWERYNYKKEKFEHNHIEDHHLNIENPIPKSDEQAKSWEGAIWRRSWGFLDGSTVLTENGSEYEKS